jgi:hypothetical protein
MKKTSVVALVVALFLFGTYAYYHRAADDFNPRADENSQGECP